MKTSFPGQLRRRRMPGPRRRTALLLRHLHRFAAHREAVRTAHRHANLAPLERVLRRAGGVRAGDTVVHRHLSVGALLRLTFAVHGGCAAGAFAPPRDRRSNPPPRKPERLTLLQRERLLPGDHEVPIALRTAARATLLARIQRIQRIEAGAPRAAGDAAASTRAAAAAMPRVPAVLLRGAAATTAIPARTRSAADAATPISPFRLPALPAAAAPPAAEAVVLPPRELSRVTDHVIRQLDRRVVSYAERRGRI